MAGPGQEVAHGRIVIDLDDRASRDLERIDRDFHRTMADIERERASVQIDVDTERLKDELKDAEKAVKDYEKTVESEENKRARAQKQRHLETLRQRADQKRAALETAKEEARAQTLVSKAEKLAQKEIDASIKQEERRARVLAENHRRYMQQLQTEARRRGALANQRLREFRADERQAHQMEVSRNRELAAIPKMQRAYASLESQLVKLAASRRRARGDKQALTLIDLKERETVANMQHLMGRLRAIGHEPISIHAELDRGTRSGHFIREAFRRGGWREAGLAAGIATGVSIGSGVSRGVRRTFSRGIITDAINAGFRGFSRFGGLLEGLSNMTVRLGPFTATLRQLAVAMTLFAPILVDVVGALGSLVSVTGAATLGVGALATGLAGGALPALIGVVTVVKPMVAQFKDLVTISKAYHKAVLQYGKGSDQAKAKLEQMNTALGNVDAQTRRAFRNAGTLSGRWKELTDESRTSAFHIMGRGLDFLNKNLGMFGRNTNSTFAAVEKATDRWFDGLESAEGKRILDTMWDNFNVALGPALDGLGNVATYLGRVGAIASGFLPGLARSFRNWSQGLADSAADADNLAERIDKVMDATRSLGQFLVSGGRLLRTFFAGGVSPGVSMLDTMTAALNRWNSALQTTQGQQDLAGFFERAVSGAQALYGFLAPIVQTFIQWATMLSPLSAAFFSVTGAVIGFVGALTRITLLQGPLQAVAATLGALWAVGKISAATTAVSNFASALFGMQRTAAATAVATTAAETATMRIAATGAVAQGAMAATGATAARSGAQVGVLRGAANRLIPALAGAGAIAGGVATAGIAAVAGAAVYGAYKFATMETGADKLHDSFDGLTERSQAATKAFNASGSQLGNVGGQAQRAALNLKLARDRLNDARRGTDEYKLALLDYRDAQRYANEAQQQWVTTSQNYLRAGRQRTALDEKRRDLAKQINAAEKQAQENARHGPGGRTGAFVSKKALEEQRDQLAALKEEYAQVTAQAEHAANAQAAAALNVKRGYQGLAPVIGQAQQKLGALARQSRGLSARIALKFDAPRDVGRVAATASRALRAGIPQRVVTRIVGDSRNAEQAIKRISALTITPKKVQIAQQGGERAVAMLERIKGTRLTEKQQRIAERGGPQVLALLERIIRRRIGDKSFSINARDNASGTISGIIGQINAIPSARDVYIRAHYSSSGSLHPGMNAMGGISQGFAAGGSTGSTPDSNRIERAAREASQRATRNIRSGGVISRPTYLTGEENRREIVISTNPAYRRQNLAYLRMAARQLGAGVISAASGFEEGGYYAPTTAIGPNMRPSGGGTQLGNRKIRRIARKPRRRSRLYARQDNWARYIGGLHTQQEDWERELSIREQSVIEPDSFLKEVSRTPDQKLPDGTVVPGVPKFDIDQTVVATFTKQLQSVKAAFDKLVQITVELVAAIPRAINAADNEWRVRDINADRFKDARDRHRKLARASKDDKVKAYHNKKADKADRGLQAERAEQKKLSGNISQYKTDRKEAGFDEREFRLGSGDYGRQIAAVAGRAAEEKTRENEQASGGSGGAGGGATSAPLGVQLGLASAAKLEALQQFGSNVAPLTATPGGLAPSGSGTLASLATNPVVAGAAIGGAIGSTIGGTSTSSIISGGTTAAQTVAQPTTTTTATSTAVAPAPTGTEQPVTVNNYFQEPPPDPHTWSAGTAFELGALL